MTRRQLLFDTYLGLGGLALADMLAAETGPHHPCKAKSCIFLFMEGGVSQMDTFEYKPALDRYAGKQMPKVEGAVGEVATFAAAPNHVIPPVAPFRQHGACGRWVSDILPHLSAC